MILHDIYDSVSVERQSGRASSPSNRSLPTCYEHNNYYHEDDNYTSARAPSQ